jgi:LuxR family transcriptional regulator, quorum-sensing system regulator LasR
MVEMKQLMALLASETEESWSENLFSLARQQGFDQVLYGVVGSRQAKLESAFLRSNYSPAWRARYDAEKLHYVDPTVSHCLVSSLPIVWEPDTFDTAPLQRAFYEEACGHGIRTGITFPIHGPAGEFGVISFASDSLPDAEFDAQVVRNMADLSLIRDYAFESSLKFIAPPAPAEPAEPPPRLTPRELEVLKWVMVGKSSWEISKITSCSEATVNFHIGNVRQKFKVNTRQQALVKAISLGILTPEGQHR